MIDRNMVQKELLAAVQRGQEQVRKSQEQVRKGREAVTGVVSELTRSVPGLPTPGEFRIPTPAELRAHARGLADTARQTATPYAERVRTAHRDLTDRARQNLPYAERILAAQQDLAERARRAGIADQVTAAHRTLTERVLEASKVATPIVAEGKARLTQMVGSWADATKASPAADSTVDAPVVEIGSDDTADRPKPKAKSSTTAKSASKAKLSVAPEAGATAVSKPRTPKS